MKVWNLRLEISRDPIAYTRVQNKERSGILIMAAAPSTSIQDQIKAQGEVVRRLKKDKEPEETVSIGLNSVPVHAVYILCKSSHMEVT